MPKPQENNIPYAVVIGGTNMDICGKSTGKIIEQDSNSGTVTLSPGGVGRNIAENLARLNIKCHLFTAIGDDDYGTILNKQCREVGIDITAVLQVKNTATSTYLSILDDDGDLSVAINDMAIIDQLKPDHIKKHEKIVHDASLIIADTNINESIFDYLSKNFPEKPIFVDAVSTNKVMRIKPYLNSIHSLKLNRIEANALCGIQNAGNEKLPAMANRLHGYGVKRVFITLGPDGVFYSDETTQRLETAPKSNSQVINASGAGDAFVAGMAYAWLQKWDLINSVQFALSAASVALAHSSTINPAMSVETVNRLRKTEYGK